MGRLREETQEMLCLDVNELTYLCRYLALKPLVTSNNACAASAMNLTEQPVISNFVVVCK